MTRREKLLQKMHAHPEAIRFSEVDALLRYEGFVLFNRRGSHCTYHRADGRVLTVVCPHGRHKTCRRTDIGRLLEALER